MSTVPPKNARVLIVRLSAMGDVIHAMPAVSALRRQRPDLHIGWVIEERWAPLLTGRPPERWCDSPRDASQPLADSVYAVNMKRWRRRLLARSTRNEISALRVALRRDRYHAAIDLQGAFRSALVARGSGAQEIIGAREPREAIARLWYSQSVPTPARNVVEQAAETIAAWSGEPLALNGAEFPVDPSAESWADQQVSGCSFAILNPGAGWGAKCWPAERYGRVAVALAAEGIVPIINAGPGEEPLAAAAVAASNGAARTLACSLPQLIALTRRASLFIGGDTGPMHLASAMRVPVVGIWGPTDPERNGPYGGKFINLRHPQSRRDHSRRAEPEAGLLTITPEEVIAAARELLASARKQNG